LGMLALAVFLFDPRKSGFLNIVLNLNNKK
jgi:hypothetical protein